MLVLAAPDGYPAIKGIPILLYEYDFLDHWRARPAVLSAKPGQFLLKDIVLFGVALWTLGDSLVAGAIRPVA